MNEVIEAKQGTCGVGIYRESGGFKWRLGDECGDRRSAHGTEKTLDDAKAAVEAIHKHWYPTSQDFTWQCPRCHQAYTGKQE